MNARPRHLTAEARRTATVEAVVELAARQNPSDITTAAIAGRMGVTQGALFRHFPSKDAIMQAVMVWMGDRVFARIDKAAAAAASPVAALEAMFMAHVDFISKHPGVPRMLFGELQHSRDTPAKHVAQTLLRQYGKRLGTALEAGIAQGELDAGLDVEAAVIAYIGMFQGLVMRTLMAGDATQMRCDAPRVFAIYRRGIAGKP
ncbi:MAG TPA: TetR/AcrR family transcriptional regulator [Rhodanobacteraceae bacterium]|jgi:AcrR family transcriptional regulator|nr:TetR/AcrR family transcriptional regulator [Rhodanobacteraceae bacterium]